MAEAFGPPQGNSPPVIGSVKSMIGHAMPAAGVASLVKAVLAVSKGILRHAALRQPAAGNDPDPLQADRHGTALGQAGPRRAAVNAFGFGGINVHLIVEQAPDPARPRPGPGPRRGASHAPVRSASLIRSCCWPPRIRRRWPGCWPRTTRTSGRTAPAWPGTARPGAVCRRRLPARDRRSHRGPARRRPEGGGRGSRLAGRPGHLVQPAADAGRRRRPDAFLFPGLEAEFSHSVQDVAAHFGLSRPRRTSSISRGALGHGAGLAAAPGPAADAGQAGRGGRAQPRRMDRPAGRRAARRVTLDDPAALMFTRPGTHGPAARRDRGQRRGGHRRARRLPRGGGVHRQRPGPVRRVRAGEPGDASHGGLRHAGHDLPAVAVRDGGSHPVLAPAVAQSRTSHPPGPPGSRPAQIAVWSATIGAVPDEESSGSSCSSGNWWNRSGSAAPWPRCRRWPPGVPSGRGRPARLADPRQPARADHLAIPVNVASERPRPVAAGSDRALGQGYTPDLASLDAGQPQPPPALCRPAACRSGWNWAPSGSPWGKPPANCSALAAAQAGASPAAAAPAAAQRPGHPSAAAEFTALLKATTDAAAAVLAVAGQEAGEGGRAREAAPRRDDQARAPRPGDEPMRRTRA